MKITLKQTSISNIRSLVRLDKKRGTVGNADVFYGIYSISTDCRDCFGVAVEEDSELRLITLDSLDDGLKLYELVSNNEVDLVSFDGVADDFICERNRTIYCDSL